MATHRAVSSAYEDAFQVFDQAAVVRMYESLVDHIAATEKRVLIRLSQESPDG
jgi:hypothetical protein